MTSETGAGDVVGDSRRVRFEACFNFRDLGGYDAGQGGRVRRGVLYRSDSLHWMTASDVAAFSSLGVRTVVDLRTTVEVGRDGHPAGMGSVRICHHPLFEEDALPFKRAERDDPEPPAGRDYLAIATVGRDQVAAAFRSVVTGDPAVVFHCSAGKDRTGILAALLLATLGVPDDVIAADFALSEESLQPAWTWAKNNAPDYAESFATLPAWLLRTRPETMHAFLGLLRDRHGSIGGYLTSIGVDEDDIALLRTRFLEN